MDLQIFIITADLVPIENAVIEFSNALKTTDKTGTTTLPISAVPFTIKVSKQNYIDNVVTVSAMDPQREWDDAGTTFRPISGSPSPSTLIVMEIRLGRISFCPTIPLNAEAEKLFRVPDEKFETFYKNEHYNNRKYNPDKINMLQHAFTKATSDTQSASYSFISDSPEFHDVNFWTATEPEMLGDRNGQGWRGLKNPQSRVVKPQLEGNFMMVEWTSPATPGQPQTTVNANQKCAPVGLDRYLVGLWRPRSSVVPGSVVDGTPVPRDVVLFYHPTTGPPDFPSDKPPYRCAYPYSLNQYKDDGKFDLQILGQQYVELLWHYIWWHSAQHPRFLAHQMLATQRDALLIIAVQPSGQWNLLNKAETVSRLISEAILFEHRQHPAADVRRDLEDSAPVWNDRGGLFQKLISMQHVPVPPIGRVVTAGFSAGVGAIRSLLISAQSYPVGRTPPQRTWAMEARDPYQSNPKAFLDAWQEIWDLDGSRQVLDPSWYPKCPIDYGYLVAWSGLLASWQSQQKSRLIRVYRTTETMQDTSRMATFNKILGRPDVASQTDVWRSNQRTGASGSWVMFPYRYLAGRWPAADDKIGGADGNSPGRPEFWRTDDDHQPVPSLCFANAAGNSKLRKLSF
ncbi:hypothetical protein BDV96DRAFT_571905 [Lophiotrema nucula]|uniref:Uncharacterized protein n=1 Tax=Lophiotrema nucula TaxID=690887 RepID=A0A6A5ZDP7_9PLEO|nr:hypothetical protein BDV96DRAFT_571905 [Lophiotrema nucula]